MMNIVSKKAITLKNGRIKIKFKAMVNVTPLLVWFKTIRPFRKIRLFGFRRKIRVSELIDEFSYLKTIRNSTTIYLK